MPTADELTQRSTVIFRGTVSRVPGSTLSALEGSNETVVVRVDEPLRWPEGLHQQPGIEVTVRPAEPGTLAKGEAHVFYTVVWLIGDGIALQEVGHQPLESGVAAAPAIVTDALSAHAELQELARVNQAQAIVAGKVTAVRPSTVTGAAAGEIRPISEHDPLWHEAEIEISEVLKGDVPQQRAVVMFPSSTDVMWHRAPKFQTGQNGVWLLHAEQVPAEAAAALPSVFTALDPSDFRSPDELDQVRQLVKKSEPRAP